MRKKFPFLPKGGRVCQLPPFPHWRSRWWVLSASSVDASSSLAKPLRFGALLVRSTPFPDGSSRSPMSQLLPDCNTSFQKSFCMGGTVSGIHQCCLSRGRLIWLTIPFMCLDWVAPPFLMEAPFHGVTLVHVDKHPYLGQLQHLLLSPVLPSRSDCNCLETA